MTKDFRAGDVAVVKKSFGHYVQNTGTTDLQGGGVLSSGILELDNGRKLQNDGTFNWTGGTIYMGYGGTKEYVQALRDIVVVIMIEKPGTVDNLEEVLAVEGVDKSVFDVMLEEAFAALEDTRTESGSPKLGLDTTLFERFGLPATIDG